MFEEHNMAATRTDPQIMLLKVKPDALTAVRPNAV